MAIFAGIALSIIGESAGWKCAASAAPCGRRPGGYGRRARRGREGRAGARERERETETEFAPFVFDSLRIAGLSAVVFRE